MRASTTRAVAALAKATWRLVPERTKPSPSATARTWMPFGPKPFSGSSHAGVRIASPVTMRGSHASFCSWLPDRARAPPERMELTKCGDGANERPNSS